MNELRFAGDWSIHQAGAAALAAGALVWWLYRRQLAGGVAGQVRWILPLLRAAAVVMILLMLAGPVLHHRRVIGELSRLWIFVDDSASMSIPEPHFPLERKILWLIDAGLLPAHMLPEQDRATDQSLADAANRLALSGDAMVLSALARFDRMSRWDRLQSILLDKQGGLLGELAAEHDVRLLLMEGATPRPIWSSTAGEPAPQSLAAPEGTITDLAGPLQAVAASAAGSTAQGAVILLTDGRHNSGPSPIEAARLLGAGRLSVYAIGLGAMTPPPDLAVVNVQGPESVHREDRLRGTVTINDLMPAGKPFKLRFQHAGRILSERQMTSQGTGLRLVEFDLPIAELVAGELAGMQKDVRAASLPMTLEAVIQAVEGETRADNNQRLFHYRAITSEQRLLILDGRARWETRYLRNMFERDPRWKVNTIIAGPGAEQAAIRRGSGPGLFPADRRSLFNYDLIVLGELPADLLNEAEKKWLAEFVSIRGGGMIFIDGPRSALRSWAEGPLGALIPVHWTDDRGLHDIVAIEPTELGRRRAALSIASSPEENLAAWRGLAVPHWTASATLIEGAGETLVEAAAGDRRVPVIAERRVGMGKALYCGTDEMWRWRYEAADRFHVQLWRQLAAATMEEPFAAADQFISLDSGRTVYQPGETARIRARLRDGEGRPVAAATVEALLTRAGGPTQVVMLAADESDSGLFRGSSPQLEPGEYELGVRVSGIPEERLRARTKLIVEPPPSAEMIDLTCGTELLDQMAGASGGRFLPEEKARRIKQILQPLTAGRVIESDTILWQGYGWFTPIIALLAAEWFLRKRSGLL